jgi:hypothetical protein
MKKIIILLIIILGISLIAYAGANEYPLEQGCSPDVNLNEGGWVIVNTNPQKTILNFHVDGLTVGNGERYWAIGRPVGAPSGDAEIFGELKVNKFGSGHLNVHVAGGISDYYIGVECKRTGGGSLFFSKRDFSLFKMNRSQLWI